MTASDLRVATTPTLWDLCRPGLRALQQHWRPFILIQIAALAALLSYFYIPAVTAAVTTLAEWNKAGGWVSAAIASALAGGLLPEFAKLATGIDPKPLALRVRDTAFTMAFFVVNGTSVYFFYLLQDHLFGASTSFLITIKKVAFDQFVFTPFFSLPMSLAAFTYLKHNFNLPATTDDLRPRPLLRRLPSLTIPAWSFWIPMTLMIYSLPQTIQFVLFSFALGAWSLLMVFIATKE